MCLPGIQGRSVLINTIFTTYWFHRVGSVRKDGSAPSAFSGSFSSAHESIYRRKAEAWRKWQSLLLSSQHDYRADVRARMAGVTE